MTVRTDTMPRPPDSLPPAPKLVWLILMHYGPLTPPEIAKRFNLPKSTVHDALDELDEYITSDLAKDHASTRSYMLKSEYRTKTDIKG